jgi:hypothetical protein
MPRVGPDRSAATSRRHRWGAVTAVSPLKRRRIWWLKLVFLFSRHSHDIVVQRLIDMRVIALGRWTLLPSAKRPRYLAFETNWSGSDASYIPDFAMLMPTPWRFIWNNTRNFPGPLPTTRLLAHVATVDWGTDCYWSDYREDASTQVVVKALQLQPQLERFIKRTRGVAPDEFAERWRRFSTKVQDLL